MRMPTWRVAGLLLGSGACALIYQLGWTRDFRLIFGASTAASAAVLAIFIGGLGIGGVVLGRRADRADRPLLLYSQLESIVAVSAAASPLLLGLVRTAYIALGGTSTLGATSGAAVRLILSAIVLAVPTIAMGGTLPAAARAVTRRGDTRRQDVAALYGMNTVGAVGGCVICTFYMLEVFGTRDTLWLAAAVNLLIAIMARQLDRTWAATVLADQADDEASASKAAALCEATGLPPTRFVLIASATVGFAFFLMELVWYRMLGPLLGGSVFTFGLILAVALAGIGIGGLLYAVAGTNRPATLSGFAITCLLEAFAIAVPYALGDRVAILTLVLLPLGHVTFSAHMLAWSFVAAVVVLAPAVVAGYQFPLLIALFGRGREHVGTQIGLAYAANTAGAILGSLAGGFGLLPWLSAPGAWRLVALTLIVLGAAAVALASGERPSRRFAVQGAFVAATLLLLTAPGPTAVWRHAGIGAGRAGIGEITSANQLRAWSEAQRAAVVWEGDGVESSVALGVEAASYAFVVNGKSDGSARSDAGTQVMAGLIGALLAPNVRQSLVVGLGTGSTSGWLGVVPGMQRVDVVELEPLILKVARACEPVNQRVLDNPVVHISIADAREALLTTRRRYDLIASEPSNPFRAGVASLFTREYYRAVSDRLTDDGVFVQWIQAYEIDARTFRTVYATMASAFPYVESWQGSPNDALIVGAKRPLRYSADLLRARMRQEPFASALRDAWRATDLNGVLAHFVAGDAVARAVARDADEINTDDRNVVEFGFGRAIGATETSVLVSVKQFARSLHADRPPMPDAGAVNWPAVDTSWVSYLGAERRADDEAPRGPAAEQSRQIALTRYFRDDDLAGARAAWAAQQEGPRDENDLAMLADLNAEQGSDAAMPYIDALRAYQPTEADTILARLRVKQGRVDDAAAAIEAALVRLRTDPWPIRKFKLQAVATADSIGTDHPAHTRDIFDALSQPFSVRAIDAERLAVAAFLTRRLDFAGLCRGAISALEPHVPWTRDFLDLRRTCYDTTKDPRAARATDDFVEFLSHDAAPFAPPHRSAEP